MTLILYSPVTTGIHLSKMLYQQKKKKKPLYASMACLTRRQALKIHLSYMPINIWTIALCFSFCTGYRAGILGPLSNRTCKKPFSILCSACYTATVGPRNATSHPDQALISALFQTGCPTVTQPKPDYSVIDKCSFCSTLTPYQHPIQPSRENQHSNPTLRNSVHSVPLKRIARLCEELKPFGFLG